MSTLRKSKHSESVDDIDAGSVLAFGGTRKRSSPRPKKNKKAAQASELSGTSKITSDDEAENGAMIDGDEPVGKENAQASKADMMVLKVDSKGSNKTCVHAHATKSNFTANKDVNVAKDSEGQCEPK